MNAAEPTTSSNIVDKSYDATSKPCDIPKKRALSKHSIGNKHIFNQQLTKKPKSSSTLNKLSSEIIARESFKDLKILNQIEGLAYCCPIGGQTAWLLSETLRG